MMLFKRMVQALVALLLATALNPAQAAQLEPVTDFGANPAQLRMYTYVPDNLRPNAPLVVALHGCFQNASLYDDETGWTKYADTWGFAVVLPEQNPAYNWAGCFNWFVDGFAAAESVSIKSMIDHAIATHGLNADRVYVTGVSAGGATAANLLATYPGTFAGGALIAGIAHGCADGATTIDEAIAIAQGCMLVGSDKSAQEWGDKVRASSGGHEGAWPKVVIWQGGEDIYVVPSNQTELAEQWLDVHGADQNPDLVNTIRGAEHKVYLNTLGQAVVETYLVPQMGHGVAVDPGTEAWECGSTGAFNLDADICSTYYIAWDFGLMLPEHPRQLTADLRDYLRSLLP